MRDSLEKKIYKAWLGMYFVQDNVRTSWCLISTKQAAVKTIFRIDKTATKLLTINFSGALFLWALWDDFADETIVAKSKIILSSKQKQKQKLYASTTSTKKDWQVKIATWF